MNFTSMATCVNCSAHDLVEDVTNGIMVCRECGVVNENNMMHATWEENAIVTEPLYKKCSQLQFNAKTKLQNNLKSSIQMTFKQRNELSVFEDIGQICQSFSENVIHEAKVLYQIMNDRRLSRGKIRKGLIACCIIHACKQVGVPRTVQEISDISKIPVPLIVKCDKIFKTRMRDIVENPKLNTRDLVRRYCSQLPLEKNEINQIIKYINHILEDDIHVFHGKKPPSVVTSLIVFSSKQMGIPVCKKHISKQFNTSTVTINKLLREIKTCYE